MSAILCIWNNVTPGSEAEYEDWYWKEHFRQRIGHPGFISGRQYRANRGLQRYYTLYELEAVARVQIGEYADSLNAPSDWSRAMMGKLTDMRRVIGNVTFDQGRGVGGALVALRVFRHARWSAALRETLAAQALAPRHDHVGVVRTRLLETSHEATNAGTEERRLRKAADVPVEWAVLVETETIERAESIGAELQADVRRLAGAQCEFDCVTYRLAYWAPGTATPAGKGQT